MGRRIVEHSQDRLAIRNRESDEICSASSATRSASPVSSKPASNKSRARSGNVVFAHGSAGEPHAADATRRAGPTNVERAHPMRSGQAFRRLFPSSTLKERPTGASPRARWRTVGERFGDVLGDRRAAAKPSSSAGAEACGFGARPRRPRSECRTAWTPTHSGAVPVQPHCPALAACRRAPDHA